ncbi:MAG: hypothetical protein ACI92E_002778 [Oceanicoccus sp.]|jgi:hypothetical protein
MESWYPQFKGSMPYEVHGDSGKVGQAKSYKLSDGAGMFLLVKTSDGKYWRMKYRFAAKEKLLALGCFPIPHWLKPENSARQPASSWPAQLPRTSINGQKNWHRAKLERISLK